MSIKPISKYELIQHFKKNADKVVRVNEFEDNFKDLDDLYSGDTPKWIQFVSSVITSVIVCPIKLYKAVMKRDNVEHMYEDCSAVSKSKFYGSKFLERKARGVWVSKPNKAFSMLKQAFDECRDYRPEVDSGILTPIKAPSAKREFK